MKSMAIDDVSRDASRQQRLKHGSWFDVKLNCTHPDWGDFCPDLETAYGVNDEALNLTVEKEIRDTNAAIVNLTQLNVTKSEMLNPLLGVLEQEVKTLTDLEDMMNWVSQGICAVAGAHGGWWDANLNCTHPDWGDFCPDLDMAYGLNEDALAVMPKKIRDANDEIVNLAQLNVTKLDMLQRLLDVLKKEVDALTELKDSCKDDSCGTKKSSWCDNIMNYVSQGICALDAELNLSERKLNCTHPEWGAFCDFMDMAYEMNEEALDVMQKDIRDTNDAIVNLTQLDVKEKPMMLQPLLQVLQREVNALIEMKDSCKDDSCGRKSSWCDDIMNWVSQAICALDADLWDPHLNCSHPDWGDFCPDLDMAYGLNDEALGLMQKELRDASDEIANLTQLNVTKLEMLTRLLDVLKKEVDALTEVKDSCKDDNCGKKKSTWCDEIMNYVSQGICALAGAIISIADESQDADVLETHLNCTHTDWGDFCGFMDMAYDMNEKALDVIQKDIRDTNDAIVNLTQLEVKEKSDMLKPLLDVLEQEVNALTEMKESCKDETCGKKSTWTVQ
ncbi:hypothetical protein Q1695_004262 [Nippostrongylus brasiliensis]|nr:hypothetical protein Q1695_004262 [Nippostrongylus brasiliensis]